jgi:molybdopterin molybdotransferase
MRSVQEAVATVLSAVHPTGVEDVPLGEAAGRVLARDVIAGRALPGCDNSAMDGYAVRAAELPGTFPVIGVSAAGAPFEGAVPAGSVVRIFTGAVMPAGLDGVVLQEDAKRDGDRVTFASAVEAGDNLRLTGEDLGVGERAVAAGTRLGSGELGLLAALGVTSVAVHRRPRVAVLATGDELVDAAVVPGPGQVVDSSRYALCEAVRALGGDATYLGIVPDDREASVRAITAAMDYDVVLTTGGVSVGDRDFVKPAFEGAGVTLEMWKVAMKPGKPLAFGRGPQRASGGRTLVFGLPGNPVSSTVSFELFVRPALLALQGVKAPARPRAPVTLPRGYQKPAGRAHYLRAFVERRGAALIATLHPKQGSAMLTSLVGINALVEIDAETTSVGEGDEVTALLLEAV